MMDKFQLQKLRDLPIEGVAERLGLRVCRHKCLCPFHDDHHASLSFSVSRNTFRCFACGAHGGTIDLVMQHENKDFLEACKWLADESLTPIPSPIARGEKNSSPMGGGWEGARFERFFLHPWLSPAAKKFLFEERRLDPRVVRWCRLTSWRDKQGIDWLQIPYYNMEGRLVGLQNRNLSLTPDPSPIERGEKKASPTGGGLDGAPRFRFPQGSECGIYNLPVLNTLSTGEDLYITEGSSDCWAMLSAGRKALAIPSATLLKPKDIEQLLSLSLTLRLKFHMYPDRDEPGERLFLQLKELLPNLEHHQLPLGCKDFSEFYLKMRNEKNFQIE